MNADARSRHDWNPNHLCNPLMHVHRNNGWTIGLLSRKLQNTQNLKIDVFSSTHGLILGGPALGLRHTNLYCNDNDEVVQKLCKEGRLKDAIHVVEHVIQQKMTDEAPKGAYICLLKCCARRKLLTEGKQVHALMRQSKYDSNIFLSNNLIDMYSKCGSILDALMVFNTMPERNVFSWTIIISAYVDGGKFEEAIHFFKEMQKNGIPPDKFVCGVVLKACARTAALEEGKQIHSLILQKGLKQDAMLQNILIDMYAKCGCLEDARELFENMSKRDIFSWNTMITGYVQNGLGMEALALYEQMEQEGMQAGIITFVCILKACASIVALEQGRLIHSLILKRGLDQDVFIQSSLVNMYAKCGCLEDAHKLFNCMSERDVASWNAIIAGYAQKGFGKEALALYEQMKEGGMQADIITFVCILKACASIAALEQGRHIHSLILKRGFDQDVIVQSTLVDMYAKCGCLEDARAVFNNMNERNEVSWNAMIAGYAQNGLGKEALALYKQMKQEGMRANKVAFISVLKACANSGELEQGKQIHSVILEKGFEQDVAVQNALVDMYAKCGCLQGACDLFNNMGERDVVSWNAMISGYVQNGLGNEALALYEQMEQGGMQANKVTFVCVLKACASIAALEQGKQIHSLILERGFELDLILQNTLVDMYAKCGCLEVSRELFNNMSERDVVLWNTMIAGYAQNGMGKEALALYEQMKEEGVQVDSITLVSVLNACANIAAFEQGKLIHSLILEKGYNSNVIVQSSLIDMYAKCGHLEVSLELFNNTSERDVVSWSTMIAGYAHNGMGKEALALYEQMEQECIHPDDVTYTCLLSACSHSGLIEEGFRVFDSMYKYIGIMPTLEHYACMVDLLGRAGLLAEAEDFIMKMPIQPNSMVWMSLLGAARTARNAEIGQHAFDYLVKLEPEHAPPNLLLIDIYAAIGQMDKVAEVRK